VLVLTRKVGESIVIGDDVLVHVTAVRGNKAQLAIEAPTSLRVDRSEVREARKRQEWPEDD
jgi:carbon storage regulator